MFNTKEDRYEATFSNLGIKNILIRIRKLTLIQMSHVDMDEVKNGRKAFTKEEWMDILLRSIGMEPDRAKWLLIAHMIPLVENNFNMCELGPRSTDKSYIYEQISPNSILVAGGQTTVANLSECGDFAENIKPV